MTEKMLVVFGILAVAIGLFAWGRPRADIVGILVVLALMSSGILTPVEALAGFGSPVVILIAAVFVVSEGLVNTGVAQRLGEAVVKVGGGNEMRLIVMIMLLAGVIGSVLSSSALAAMLIPVVLTIADRTGLNRKRMLMPLCISVTISGMMTLIASSSNIIIENILREHGATPLGFFSWAPFGIVILVISILFTLSIGRDLLSSQRSEENAGDGAPKVYDTIASYDLIDRWHRLSVLAGSSLVGRSPRCNPRLWGTTAGTARNLRVPDSGTARLEYQERLPARNRAPIAVAILIAMVAIMVFQSLPNAAAALIAALAMVAGGCVRLENLYRVISWKTLVLIAGMLPLATALSKTGATTLMANGLVKALGSLGPNWMIGAVFLITALVGLFISNSVTAVLIAPIALEAADALRVSPQAFAMTVAIACSAAYVTPVSSPANMLVMEPGGYRFGDYVKVGLPMLLLTLIATVALVQVFFPL
jgi:di/tricarboxylate transporter